jgi:predicted nucleic acid-binding Zn ribbon protein
VDNSGGRSVPGDRPGPDPGSEQGGGADGAVHTPGSGDRGADPSSRRGADLARDALAAAREASAAKRAAAGGRSEGVRPVRRGANGLRRPRRRGWSGAGADDRDPQTLGRLASRLSGERGWAPKLSGGAVFGRWAELVGAEVAEHARPVSLREGELTVQADSTAWATQLRLLQRQLLGRLAAGLGDGVVTRMRIHGPTAPSWRRGPRHVSGRGPRDTYG